MHVKLRNVLAGETAGTWKPDHDGPSSRSSPEPGARNCLCDGHARPGQVAGQRRDCVAGAGTRNPDDRDAATALARWPAHKWSDPISFGIHPDSARQEPEITFSTNPFTVSHSTATPLSDPNLRKASLSMTENRLHLETSPYLLQHENNPVHWMPWGEEALRTRPRRTTGKPILLSIGYAACHWCHVMAHESFEDPETADGDERSVRQRQGRPRGAPRRRQDLHDRRCTRWASRAVGP